MVQPMIQQYTVTIDVDALRARLRLSDDKPATRAQALIFLKATDRFPSGIMYNAAGEGATEQAPNIGRVRTEQVRLRSACEARRRLTCPPAKMIQGSSFNSPPTDERRGSRPPCRQRRADPQARAQVVELPPAS